MQQHSAVSCKYAYLNRHTGLDLYFPLVYIISPFVVSFIARAAGTNMLDTNM